MNNGQLLPPKMLSSYQARAKAGDYQYRIGDKFAPSIFIWFNGNYKTVLIGTDSSTGHVTKLTTRETEAAKQELSKYIRGSAHDLSTGGNI